VAHLVRDSPAGLIHDRRSSLTTKILRQSQGLPDIQPVENTAQGLLGTVVGGYRLVTELGSGGMGTVYYAEHLVIGRRAAIKVLRPEVSKDETIVSRFLTEARSVNDIRHPNVVEITDLGRHGELYYIVMSLLEGETLGERLERVRTLDEPSVVRIARQVTSALGTAHERGIVHRDLKPENIFLTNHPDYPDHVKILDFGIAKLVGDRKAGHQTQVGAIIGTPAYMSPEQCRGADVDHRSDVYSFAVVLYEMLTGRPPFIGEGIGDIIVGHVVHEPVPPIDLNPKISSRVNATIMRALAKDPNKRPASMRELREGLEDLPAGAAEAIAAKLDPELEKKQAREAWFVVNKLTDIIMKRIASDRLVVPSMPNIAIDCMRLLRDQNQTFKSVGVVVAKDPLLASRVLKLANSAAFPSLVPATTVEQAIARMGTEGLMIALVKFSMHQAFTSKSDRIQSAFRGIWEHSLAVALLAKDICLRVGAGMPDPNTAYLAGLLHDVGKPVVASLLLEAEKQFKKDDSVTWISDETWKRVVDESHRKVGVALARKWNLPDELSRAIEQANEYERAVPRSCANVVRLANVLAKKHGLYVGNAIEGELDQAIAAGQVLIGLREDHLQDISRGLYGRVATLIDGGDKGKPARGAAAGGSTKAVR
jgi:putative nucleotidyltransferase with HDIG domain